MPYESTPLYEQYMKDLKKNAATKKSRGGKLDSILVGAENGEGLEETETNPFDASDSDADR